MDTITESDVIATVPNSQELEYINNSFASWHINFYLDNGFSVDRSIRRGMEEYIEQLMEELIHLKTQNTQQTPPTQTQKGIEIGR